MPKFECSTCGDVFANGDELAEHIRESHSGVSGQTFECSVCGQRFSDEADLVAHMSGAHPKS